MSKKRVIFDIGHPAQVHFFKNTYWELKERNWEALIVARDKEVALNLLEKYGIRYVVLGENRGGLLNKVLHTIKNIFNFSRIVKKFKPDIIVSRFSIHSAVVSKLFGVPNIGFTDTEDAGLTDSITVPLVDAKLTANSYQKELGEKHYRYPGNIELAYLHPDRFTPDDSILNHLGVGPEKKYVILRFVSWEAHHDIGHSGLSLEDKKKVVKKISQYAQVFISSEDKLSDDLSEYKIEIPPEKMHDALYYASLYIGEGTTMASESVMLATPAIFVSDRKLGYIEEEKESGLLYQTKDVGEIVERGLKMLKESKSTIDRRYKQLIANKIDVTAFMVWFIKNYPESVEKIGSNLDLQEKFS